MRIIIYGAGAIGSAIGAELSLSGTEVVLVARGGHGEAIASGGLHYVTPDADRTLAIPVVKSVAEIAFAPGDVVLLCMKTQDTVGALESLAELAPRELPVVCTENGVASEEFALRRFAEVYAMATVILSTYLRPGEVVLHGAPVPGVFHLGRYPSGTDGVVEELASAFRAARFHAHVHADVMPFKYAKLLGNLVNTVQAVLEPSAVERVTALARDEGRAAYDAAGIRATPSEEFEAYRAPFVVAPVPGHDRFAGSTWQSLVRGTGGIESDYLAGEIVLLGRVHGVPTPVNALVQEFAATAAHEGLQPGFVSGEEFDRRLGAR